MFKFFCGSVFVVGLLTAFQANASIVSWQEEININDGRVIVVEQKRRCPDVTCRITREAWLSINLPELSNKPILWHERLNPIVVNTHKQVLYLVAQAPSCRESLLYGDPVPFYIPFKYEHDQWKLIGVEEIPIEIYDINMLLTNVPPDGTQLLTVDQKQSPALNGSSRYQKQMKRIDVSIRGRGCGGNSSNEIRRATKYSAEIRYELAMAIDDSDIEGVRNALDKGARVRSLDKLGFAPLVTAVMAASQRLKAPEAYRIIDLLIEAGADIEQQGPAGNTPLAAAASQTNSSELVTFLLNKGANVNFRGYDDTTPLYQSLRKGRAEMSEIFIRHGADVNAKTVTGWTPLHMAVVNNMDSTVKLLLDQGANINEKDDEGKTPLAWAKGNTPKSMMGRSIATPVLIDFLVKNGAAE